MARRRVLQVIDDSSWAVLHPDSNEVFATASTEEQAKEALVRLVVQRSNCAEQEARALVDSGEHGHLIVRCALRIAFWNRIERLKEEVPLGLLDGSKP